MNLVAKVYRNNVLESSHLGHIAVVDYTVKSGCDAPDSCWLLVSP